MKDILKHKTYQNILESELADRRTRNPSYSLRAFARDLGVSGSRLSEILNHKQGISLKYAKTFAEIMKFNEEEKDYFCNLVVSTHSRRKIDREVAKDKLMKKSEVSAKDWQIPAVLSLSRLNEFKSDPVWVAQRLGILEEDASKVLNNLQDLISGNA